MEGAVSSRARVTTKILSLGIEGSANKIGLDIGNEEGNICANPRFKIFTPPGEVFMPKETAEHHRGKIQELLLAALDEAKMDLATDKDVPCYPKGPGMAELLSVGALVYRTLAIMHNKPIVGVTHCIGHIEMGRVSANLLNLLLNNVLKPLSFLLFLFLFILVQFNCVQS